MRSRRWCSLKSGDVTPGEVSELRHGVILAQLDLVKKKANTMKVKAAGNATYKPMTRVVTVKVRVR